MSLRTLLDASADVAPTLRATASITGLSDHLPMTLVALHRLGASDDRLHAFAAQYAAQRQPASNIPESLHGVHWSAMLGHTACDATLRAHFGDAIRRLGRDIVLRAVLPRLLPGVATAGFHAAIRTAYGIDAAHDGEIARGLAYWASHFDDTIAPAARVSATLQVRGALDALRADAALNVAPNPHRLILDDLRAAAQRDAMGSHPMPVDVSLDTLADAALAIYLADHDFTALHLVTGVHAARRLARFVDARALARAWWPAFAAAYVAIGRPRPAWEHVRDCAPESEWHEIRACAITSDDAHDIKLVYTAWDEWRARGHGGYLRAAQAVARPLLC